MTVEELRAALHAYVAPGQGIAFWAARAAQLLDRLRSSLLELDAAASANGGSVGEALDMSDRLAAAEQRARDSVLKSQALLAGDVIFNDARDLLDGMRLQIARGRDQIGAESSARQLALRREQLLLAGGATGILAVMMLLLVPTGRRPVDAAVTPAASDPANERSVTPAAETRPALPAFDASELASLCTDIAAVADSGQIEGLLERARELLKARGVIVWICTPDRLELHAAGAAGYEPRLVARLGSIHRDTGNLTADAFRDNTVRTSAAGRTSAAAFAIPLPGPQGPAGVFAAELSSGMDIEHGTLAAARLIAAQLGAVLGSMATDAAALRTTELQQQTPNSL
jgi:hypothetical protein